VDEQIITGGLSVDDIIAGANIPALAGMDLSATSDEDDVEFVKRNIEGIQYSFTNSSLTFTDLIICD